jgi:hypothetical protein
VTDAYPDPRRSTFFADGLLPGLPLAMIALVPALGFLRAGAQRRLSAGDG